MQNRGVETVVVGKNLSGYNNLIRDAYVYTTYKTVSHIVNDSELGEYEIKKQVVYIKLTALGRKFATSISVSVNQAMKLWCPAKLKDS